MKNDDPKPVDVEVLARREPSDLIAPSSGSVLVSRLVREHFLFGPIHAVDRPVLSREELESHFAHRLGAAIIFLIHYVEYSVSPNGTLRAFTKLFLRWFITLTMLAVAVGVPLLIASQFLDSIARLIESAMKHLFFATLWLVGTICVLAALIALAVAFLSSRGRSSNVQRSYHRR